jgi:hypothetical protein
MQAFTPLRVRATLATAWMCLISFIIGPSCVSPKAPPAIAAPLVFYLLDIQGLYGGQDVYVHADGTCLVRVIPEAGRSGGGLREHRYVASLPTDKLNNLVRIAEDSRFASYRQGRLHGVPDEAYPFIYWRRGAASTIEAHKWAEEKDPRFDAIYTALLKCIKDARPLRTLYRGRYDYQWMHPHRIVPQANHANTTRPAKGEPGAAGKSPGSPLSAMTHRNSNPHLAFHALPRPEAASA